MERARIRFNRIDDCGYYKRGENTPSFGTIDTILADLKTWVEQTGFQVQHTCTYPIDSHNDLLRTFCMSIKKTSQNDYIIVTWNEIPSSEGKVSSLNLMKPFNEIEIDDIEIKDGFVPGYATYFWFLPDEHIYATIQFKNVLNGNRNLKAYLYNYIKSLSKYCIKSNDGGDTNVTGYHQNPESLSEKSKIEELYPKYNTSLMHGGGKIDHIKNNSDNITKIINKVEIDLEIESKKSLFQKILANMYVSNPSSKYVQNINVRTEINYTPTIDELDIMIDGWNAEKSNSDDIGFKLSGEEDVYWLSHSIFSFEQDIDIRRENTQVLNIDEFVRYFETNRSRLLSLIKR